FAELVGDLLAHQWLQHPVRVAGVAEREPALHAGVALVRAAVLVRDHPDQLVAARLGLERAADAAVGAGGEDRAGRHGEHDDRLLLQRRGRAGLHARAAGDALGVKERLARAWGDPGLKPLALDRQREGALDLRAGPHAPRAHDALGAVEVEVRVGAVLA